MELSLDDTASLTENMIKMIHLISKFIFGLNDVPSRNFKRILPVLTSQLFLQNYVAMPAKGSDFRHGV